MRIKSLLVAAVLITAIFGLVQGANAYTAQELQDMIANLKKQIADLQVLLDKQTAPVSVNYNCRLDKLDGENITRDKYNTKEECLEKLCDVHGPANINRDDEESRVLSRCMFNGNIIKRYVKPDNWCHTFANNLSVSDKGKKPKEVKSLQIVLAHEGFYISKTVGAAKFDGIFDTNVLQAVKSFQKKNNIPPNGKVGPATRTKLNELYGCRTTTEPSIKVTSPNGGERWERGKPYNITWDANGVTGDVIVNIKNNGTCVGSCITIVSAAVPATAGTVSFAVPADFTLGSSYDVRVGVGGSGIPEDRSNSYFSVVEPTNSNQPSVAVTWPNGGETITRNNNNSEWVINVRWSSINLLTSQKINVIRLRSESDGKEYNFASDVLASAGQKTISLPASLPDGRYKVEIKGYTSDNVLLFDASNQFFTITTEPPQPVNAVCGSSNGQSFASQPTTNLCLAGTDSAVTLNSTGTAWDWTCNGINGGTDASCSATKTDTPADTTCTPNWTCGNWSACASGLQTRVCTDSNNCGVITGKPIESQTCTSAPAAVSPTTYLTLTSPNGGGTWRKGGTYDITWNSADLPTGTTVDISLVSGYNNAKIKDIAFRVPVNTGSASFTIPASPSDVPIGRYYKVKIISSWSSSRIFDSSDNYFIIDNSVASSLNYFAAALAEIAEKIKLLFK